METLTSDLDAHIDRVRTLPPAPVVLPQLLKLLEEPDIDGSSVVELISSDPGLTAAVLRLCNSAFFSSSEPVSDLFEAVLRLGFNNVCQLVVAVVGSRAMRNPKKGYGSTGDSLWRHSVVSALAAKAMAHDAGDNEGIVFTAAILHDIGKIILAQALEDRYERLIHEVECNQASLLEGESRVLGVQHAEIGARVLARWNFPDDLVVAVRNHHDPIKALGHERLASYVYLGNLVAHFMGLGFGHHALALRGRSDALGLVGLNDREIPKYMIRTFEQFETMKVLVGG
jgi:putative nucleotidyltransferase with HDIG domain